MKKIVITGPASKINSIASFAKGFKLSFEVSEVEGTAAPEPSATSGETDTDSNQEGASDTNNEPPAIEDGGEASESVVEDGEQPTEEVKKKSRNKKQNA